MHLSHTVQIIENIPFQRLCILTYNVKQGSDSGTNDTNIFLFDSVSSLITVDFYQRWCVIELTCLTWKLSVLDSVLSGLAALYAIQATPPPKTECGVN